jgi:hypothetical protein
LRVSGETDTRIVDLVADPFGRLHLLIAPSSKTP